MDASIITTFLNKVRMKKSLAFAAGSAIIVIGWICYPIFSPYVRTPGNVLILNFNCVPQEVSFYFKSRRVQVVSARAGIDQLGRTGVIERQLVAPSEMDIVRLGDAPFVATVISKSKLLPIASLPVGTPVSTRIELLFKRVPFVDTESISVLSGLDGLHSFKCERESYAASDVANLFSAEAGFKVHHVHFIQETWSDYLLAFNNSVGNIALAILSVVLLWAMWRLGEALRTRWSVRDAVLNQRAREIRDSRPAHSVEAVKEELTAKYWGTCWWPNFWKIAGPAVGFLLTVSSLAAALHPSVQESKDAFTFLSAIQVAVISTFVGLAIRILAHIETSVQLVALRRLGQSLDLLAQHGVESK